MTEPEAELDRAIAEWLVARENDPDLLPGAFAATLADDVAARFLEELESLAEIDAITSQSASRDLPRRVGDFRMLGELGRGASGAVYDAEEVSTGRRVALKVLHSQIACDPRMVARFRREALAAASIDHPCIVSVFDCGEIAEVLWMTMERIRGQSLDRLLTAVADARDVDHERALALFGDPVAFARRFAETVDALELAHRRGIVHRDIKPANLMLRDDGRIVVLDFGLASVRDGEVSLLTRTGDFLGTPHYMAPEQAEGAERGSPQSDVYSLGAVLYECLTGEPPVERGSLAVVVDSILHREPPPPHRIDARIPERLSRVAMQCLEKDPGRRYPSAAALADDLRRFAKGQRVQARRQGPAHRLARAARRRPLVSGLVLAVALLVPAALWTWQLTREGDRQISRLERDRDLDRLPALLAGAPEHITVFGGASLRHYARYGLADAIPADGSARSPQAEAALALAADLRQRYPGDAAVLRAHAEVLLDVGDDPDAIDATLEALLAAEGAVAGDRAMAAVWERRQGREARAVRLFDELPAGDPTVDYWSGFWHQSAQRYDRAIEAFSRALAAPDLDQEHRYFALLHRGWCQSCPEICRLRAAQDDLLQAAALRPAYGTATLLWAALHCLEEDPDIPRAVGAVTEVLDGAEPWLHVLTARVLQALAEAGTWQSGPVTFGAEFSPIAAQPLPPERAAALAGLSLQLLDGAETLAPGSFEIAFHRIAGLALVGEHDEALALVEERLARDPEERRAALLLQRARVELAAGRGQLAHTSVERSLDCDPDFVAAWRFAARLAAHLGDLRRELTCVAQAARLMRRDDPQLSVFPDATALLPALELRRLELLVRLGRTAEAAGLAARGLGGELRGERTERVRAQLAAWSQKTGLAPAPAVEVADDSPLRWLVDATAPLEPSSALASAAWRGWLPPMRRDLPAGGAAIGALREAAGAVAPASVDEVGLSRLMPSAAQLAQGGPEVAARLMRRAQVDLDRDPQNGEARLMRGVVLLATQRPDEAHAYLRETIDRFPDDLRARFVQACAAASIEDVRGVRQALSRDDEVLALEVLEGAADAVALPDARRPVELLGMLR